MTWENFTLIDNGNSFDFQKYIESEIINSVCLKYNNMLQLNKKIIMPFVKYPTKFSFNPLNWDEHYKKIKNLSVMNRKKISANTYNWMIYQRMRHKKNMKLIPWWTWKGKFVKPKSNTFPVNSKKLLTIF